MEGMLGEIRLFAGPVDAATNMVPRGWKVCDGSLLNIREHEYLFGVIGTLYGGNGTRTFALPDLRSRVPVGAGTASGRPDYLLGEEEGAEQVPTQPPAAVLLGGTNDNPSVAVNSVVAASGNNLQPVLALNYIICIQGSLPQKNTSS